MKVYIYSQHIIILIISLGQWVCKMLLYQEDCIFYIIFCVFIIYPWFPTRPRM